MQDRSKLAGLEIQPNFIKMDSGPISKHFTRLFWDYYLYIDTQPFEIDQFLVQDLVLVKIYNFTYVKPGQNYCLCMLRARHKYRDILLNKIFPSLHAQLFNLFGEEYENFCCDFVNQFLEYYEGDIYEIFSRPATR